MATGGGRGGAVADGGGGAVDGAVHPSSAAS